MRIPGATLQLMSFSIQNSVSGQSQPSSSSLTPFSSAFKQPEPPLVKSEFRANWRQHKWNSEISHIASGFLYNSPSQNKVRADAATDAELLSSLFDYANINDEGVANRVWTLSPAITSAPQIWSGFVEPAFPLILPNLLVDGAAVFQGVFNDEELGREVTAWDILYNNAIPTTVFVNSDGVIQGFDFWSKEERTRVITRFFNVILGKIEKEVFGFPSQ